MLKKAAIAAVACLSVVGTAYADTTPVPVPDVNDVGHVTAGACPDHGTPVPIGDLGGGSDITIGSVGFCHLTPAPSGQFLGKEVEHLDVQEDIPLCRGPLCRKEMRFHLRCEDTEGATQDIYSPYYKNYATDGMVTRRYEFADPKLATCASIPSISVEWKYGWQDGVD